MAWTPARRASRIRLWLAAALTALVASAYLPGVGAPFLFDDLGSIPGNPNLADPWSWRALQGPDQSTVAGRPLVAWSLACNHALGGLDPTGYHLVNIGLHLTCALLLWRLLTALSRRWARSAGCAEGLGLAAAALWAVHPLQTEAVTYVVQRTELMASLFALASWWALLGALDRPERAGRLGALAVAACLAATLCKETAVAVPWVGLCLHRVTLGRDDSAAGARPSFAACLRAAPRLHAALFACWLPLGLLVAGGHRSDSVGWHHGISAWEWLLTQAQVLVHAGRLVLWPDPLVLTYHWPLARSLADAWLPGVVVLGLLAATVAGLRRGAPAALAGALVFAWLAPSSSVVPIWTEVFAERRLYLPSAALVALVVAFTARWAARAPEPRGVLRRRRALIAVYALLLVVAVPVTRGRAALFADPPSLWQHTATHQPDSALAWMQLGLAHKRTGDLVAAETALRRAVAVDPGEHRAQVDLGNVLLVQGRAREAIGAYRRACELTPAAPQPWFNLGLALVATDDDAGARLAFERCVRLDPEFLDARVALAGTLVTLGAWEAAAPHLAWILARRPGHSRARAWQRQLTGRRATAGL